MAWLDEHPPESPQFRCPRRAAEAGQITLHTAENTPDFVAYDGGAEAVANFIRTRDDPGSYHVIGDSDSRIQLVRPECEAFHDATGSNRWAYGISAATRADVWDLAPAAWRSGTIFNMARAAADYANRVKRMRGITIPARLLTRDESEARFPGFVRHSVRDPARRRDPGSTFPVLDFLNRFAAMVGVASPPPPPPVPTLGVVDVQVPVLRMNSRGGAVRSLQALLNAKSGKHLDVDGIFGPATDRAVREVQSYFRIGVDGIVGQRTWGVLFL